MPVTVTLAMAVVAVNAALAQPTTPPPTEPVAPTATPIASTANDGGNLDGGDAMAPDAMATTTAANTTAEPTDEPPPSRILLLTYPRPSGTTLAIGVGYTFGASSDITEPNTTSVRVRLPSRLQLEAVLRLQGSSSKVDDGIDESTNKAATFEVGAQAHFHVASREKTDLNAVGLVSFTHNRSNPEGADNNASSTSFGLGYGVEIQRWLGKHLAVSLGGYNPILSLDSSKQDTGGGDETKTSETSYGLVWDPTVRLLVHVYF